MPSIFSCRQGCFCAPFLSSHVSKGRGDWGWLRPGSWASGPRPTLDACVMNSGLELVFLPLSSSWVAVPLGYHKATETKTHNSMARESKEDSQEQSPNSILWIQLDWMWLCYSRAFQLHELGCLSLARETPSSPPLPSRSLMPLPVNCGPSNESGRPIDGVKEMFNLTYNQRMAN